MMDNVSFENLDSLSSSERNDSSYSVGGASAQFRWTVLVLYLFISLFGAFGNALVIIINIRYAKVRNKSVSNYYILNLAAADELYLLTLPVFSISTYAEEWMFGDIVCRLAYLVRECNKFASVLTLMALSIDRYLATFPSTGAYRRIGVGVTLCAMIWLVCLGACTPYLIYSRVIVVPGGRRSCRFYWPALAVSRTMTYAQIVLGFIVPLLIIAAFNIQLLVRLHRMRRPGEPVRRSQSTSFRFTRALSRVNSLSPSTPHRPRSASENKAASTSTSRTGAAGTSACSGLKRQPTRYDIARSRSQANMTRQLLAMVIIFAVSHLPYHVLEVWSLRTKERYTESGERPTEETKHQFIYVNLFAQILVFVASCCNPIVYGICNKNFRSLYRQVLCYCCIMTGVVTSKEIITTPDSRRVPAQPRKTVAKLPPSASGDGKRAGEATVRAGEGGRVVISSTLNTLARNTSAREYQDNVCKVDVEN